MDLEEQMDTAESTVISTKCINGHKFQVPKEKIQTSNSGKSFVTLCPKCNKVARLRKEEVYALFGINPRDPVAIGGLFSTLSSQTPSPTPSAMPKNGATLQDMMSQSTPKSNSVPDDEDEEDGEDETDEDEEDEIEDEREYTAQVEVADDVTGKKSKVRRFRVVSNDDDEDDEDDGEEEVRKTPVKAAKQNKKKAVRPRVRPAVAEEEEDEEDDEDVDEKPGRKSRGQAKRILEEDEPMDPNEILKDVIEEGGVDESSMARIFDYIDLQPDGWQPAAIQGVLQMYISPAAASKISQRYQAELYKEQKRRERERYLMSVVGTPAGNMRLNEQGTNIPPFNNPLMRGNPNAGGMGGGMGMPMNGYPPQNGDPMYGRQPPQYVDQPYGSGYPQDPRMQQGQPMGNQMPFQPMPARRTPSSFEVKQMISEELEARFEKLQQTLTQSKREDVLQDEIKQMRALVFDVLKQKSNPADQNQPRQSDPMLQMLLANQSELNKTLLTHTITKTDKEDPMQKILLQELMDLKNRKSAPPLTHTSEELTQRIQLQKLANELELSQAEYRDKAEGRVFARDLAGQALTKIGESFATAYLESQRMAAMQASSAPIYRQEPAVAPIVQTPVESAPQIPGSIESGAQPRVSNADRQEKPQEEESEKFHVKGTSRDDGSLSIPCPTCGSEMIAHPGDTKVSCQTCGSSFNAGAKPEYEYAEYSAETPQEEPVGEPVVESSPEEPKMPKGIL